MRVYHVIVESGEDWYCARALEDPSIFTQGQTLDDITENLREVVELMYGEKQVQIELVIPPRATAAASRSHVGRRRASNDTPKSRRPAHAARRDRSLILSFMP